MNGSRSILQITPSNRSLESIGIIQDVRDPLARLYYGIPGGDRLPRVILIWSNAMAMFFRHGMIGSMEEGSTSLSTSASHGSGLVVSVLVDFLHHCSSQEEGRNLVSSALNSEYCACCKSSVHLDYKIFPH